VLKGRRVVDQFTDSTGKIWSLQTRGLEDGETGKVVVENYDKRAKVWRMSLMCSGPIAWSTDKWAEYKSYSR
jgi:hypothetical protein